MSLNFFYEHIQLPSFVTFMETRHTDSNNGRDLQHRPIRSAIPRITQPTCAELGTRCSIPHCSVQEVLDYTRYFWWLGTLCKRSTATM